MVWSVATIFGQSTFSGTLPLTPQLMDTQWDVTFFDNQGRSSNITVFTTLDPLVTRWLLQVFLGAGEVYTSQNYITPWPWTRPWVSPVTPIPPQTPGDTGDFYVTFGL